MRDMARTLALVALLASCSDGEAHFVVVSAPPGAELDVGAARFVGEPKAATLSSGKLVIEPGRARSVVVQVPGACPLPVADPQRDVTESRVLSPFFDFGPHRVEAGFGARLEVTATPGCRDAARTKIAWTQIDGDTLRDVRTSDDGHTVSATMPDFAGDARSERLGVIPISARARGEIALRATWTRSDGLTEQRTVRASAAARSRGLRNVAVNTRLYLSGHGVKVVTAPPGSRAAVEVRGGLLSFAPDRTGTYQLASANDENLTLFAGRYDETPLDCGKTDCHEALTKTARTSPMATVFQRGLDGPFAGDYPSCALGCHTVGEPGLDDGGFLTVATSLGWAPSELRRAGFHDLPIPLRRLGGVGCLACHGPGTIAEPHGRDALLAADVCATCHDAPPRYGHVEAWRSTRMSRGITEQGADTQACARCHSTWGFLGRPDHAPPTGAPPAGIACVACHAVHPEGGERGAVIGATCAEALRRDAPVPSLLQDALPSKAEPSRVCLGCHSPADDDDRPSASAAAIWAGRGGLDPESGAPISAESQHGEVERGCIGCHRSGPDGLGRGASHGFLARDEACGKCHAPRRDPSIRERALALFHRRFTTELYGDQRPHADRQRPPLDRTTQLGRAAWDLFLVMEDPAADSHNAPYARTLLDAAEKTVQRVRDPRVRLP